MQHYICTENVDCIDIDRILITRSIADTISVGIGLGSFHAAAEALGLHFKGNPKTFSTPLNRIDRVINGMESHIPLDPIILRPVNTPSGTFYDVIDGRHRFAASVVLGFLFVPYKLM